MELGNALKELASLLPGGGIPAAVDPFAEGTRKTAQARQAFGQGRYGDAARHYGSGMLDTAMAGVSAVPELGPLAKASKMLAMALIPARAMPNVPSTPGHVYHATNTERAKAIADEGLKPHLPHEYTPQTAWPDGAVDPRVYFTPNAGAAHIFAPEEGASALLRAPSSIGVKAERGTGDVYTQSAVPPSLLEMLANDGRYYPVQRFYPKPPEGLPLFDWAKRP